MEVPEPGLKTEASSVPMIAANKDVTKYQIITFKPIFPKSPVGSDAEPLIKEKKITGTTIIFNIDTGAI